ncbi:hypothetical protein ACJJTC_011464 [Scirpophaga incertulas]
MCCIPVWPAESRPWPAWPASRAAPPRRATPPPGSAALPRPPPPPSAAPLRPDTVYLYGPQGAGRGPRGPRAELLRRGAPLRRLALPRCRVRRPRPQPPRSPLTLYTCMARREQAVARVAREQSCSAAARHSAAWLCRAAAPWPAWPASRAAPPRRATPPPGSAALPRPPPPPSAAPLPPDTVYLYGPQGAGRGPRGPRAELLRRGAPLRRLALPRCRVRRPRPQPPRSPLTLYTCMARREQAVARVAREQSCSAAARHSAAWLCRAAAPWPAWPASRAAPPRRATPPPGSAALPRPPPPPSAAPLPPDTVYLYGPQGAGRGPRGPRAELLRRGAPLRRLALPRCRVRRPRPQPPRSPLTLYTCMARREQAVARVAREQSCSAAARHSAAWLCRAAASAAPALSRPAPP